MIKAVKNGDKSAEEELLTTLNYIEELQSQLEQKEKQLNDIREYVEEYRFATVGFYLHSDKLLSIIERNNNESKK